MFPQILESEFSIRWNNSNHLKDDECEEAFIQKVKGKYSRHSSKSHRNTQKINNNPNAPTL